MTGQVPALAAIALVLAVGAGAVAGPLPAAADACPDGDLEPYPDNLDRVAVAIVCEIDAQRAAAGLVALRADPRLDRSSQAHTDDMVGSHFLAHEAPGHPSLLTRIRRTGYFDRASGGQFTENIGAAPQDEGTAANVVDAWMQSESHRANILFAAFRDVGVGARTTGPDPTFYADRPSVVYTTDFGRRYYRRCRSARGGQSPPQRYCRRRR